MTTTHTTPAATADISTSTGVITASDFSDRVTDRDRNDWTAGKMRHVITALDGRRVAITTDRRTGHTDFNVRLVGLTTSMTSNYPRVQIEYTHSDGTTHVTNRLLFNLGPVITLMPAPVTDKRNKWTALENWREETSAAAKIAHDRREAAGLTGGHTTSEIRVHAHGVRVHYSPDMDKLQYGTGDINKPENAHWSTEVTPADIAAELDRRAQVMASYAAEYERAAAGVPEGCEA